MPNKLKQWENGKEYASKLAFLATIESEVAPALEASRKADDLLNRVTRSHNGIDAQGYANLPGCSRLDIHTMGHLKGTESLVAPESFEACAVQGMEAGETNSRNIADNNL